MASFICSYNSLESTGSFVVSTSYLAWSFRVCDVRQLVCDCFVFLTKHPHVKAELYHAGVHGLLGNGKNKPARRAAGKRGV